MMKKYLLLLTSGLLATSLLAQIRTPSAQLGYGYSNDAGQPLTTNCLNQGTPTLSGSNVGLVEASKQYDMNDVSQQLNFSTALHVNIGLFSLGNTSDFFHYIENDQLTETFIYRARFEFKDVDAQPQQSILGKYLNTDGLAQWKAGPSTFRNACGDSYVAQMHNGAYLYVVYQFHFLTQIDREKFDDVFSASYATLGDLTAKYQQEENSLHLQGTIHIMAYQFGGDPTQLSSIFKSTFPWQPSPLSQCSLSDLKACDTITSNIANYAAVAFPAQIAKPYGDRIPTGAGITGNETNNYDHLNPAYQTSSTLTPLILQDRDALGSKLNDYYSHIQRANFIKTQIDYPFIFDAYQEQLNNYISNLQSNITLVQAAGQSCFDTPETCDSTYQLTLNKLAPDNVANLTLPDEFAITSTYTAGGAVQKIFAAQPSQPSDKTDPTPPSVESMLGIDIATPGNHYKATTQFVGAQVFISIYQADTGQPIESYTGNATGNGGYTGSITAPGGATLGTWSGQFTQSSTTRIN
jgi:hypothetical protein